jgi:hypothetical protein
MPRDYEEVGFSFILGPRLVTRSTGPSVVPMCVPHWQFDFGRGTGQVVDYLLSQKSIFGDFKNL